MKLRKQIKNRVVAVVMLAVVFISNITVAFASESGLPSYDVKYTDNRNSDNFELYRMNFSAIHRVTFINKKSDFIGFAYISKSPSDASCVYLKYAPNYGTGYQVSSGNYKLESEDANKSVGSFEFTYNDTTYYIAHMSFMGSMSNGTFSGSFGRFYSVNDDQIAYTFRNYITQYITGQLDETKCTLISDGDSESSSDKSTWPGSPDNPISDENIGTLVLKKSKCYWVKDGSMDVSQRVQWANKTDTDFSLTNNKYAITRIEVKIGNRVTYFGDVEHHGAGKKVDNFGKVYPFKYVIATDNPHDFSFKDMLSASKTDLTKYNAAMLEHEYDLYFRVVCGTAYGTSAEWHCGNWTRYRVTDDPKQDGKNESDNGHFNDNGEWEKDKDTDVDSGGIGNVDDKDDLNDDFNNFKDSENWKEWLNKEGLDLDSAKTFIDQVADVPKMIGDLFSFFPDWVKYSFALGFAFIPVIIVIKFLRG